MSTQYPGHLKVLYRGAEYCLNASTKEDLERNQTYRPTGKVWITPWNGSPRDGIWVNYIDLKVA